MDGGLIERNKSRFIELCEKIKRPGIQDLMRWLESSDFFTAPASTKYHGCHEGGLCEHSLNVADALVTLCGATNSLFIPESIFIVSLFHDLCKVNFYKKSRRNVKTDAGWIEKDFWEIDEKFPCGDHADKSIIILQQYIKLLPEEIMAIRAHMGGFDTSVKGGSFMVGKIFEKSELAVLLHCADLIATYMYEERD